MNFFSSPFSAFFLSTVLFCALGVIGVVFFPPVEDFSVNTQKEIFSQQPAPEDTIISPVLLPEKKIIPKKISFQEFTENKNIATKKTIEKIVEPSVEKFFSQEVSLENISVDKRNFSTFEVEKIEQITEKILAINDGSDFFPEYSNEVQLQIKEYNQVREEEKKETADLNLESIEPEKKKELQKKYVATSSTKIKKLEDINAAIGAEHTQLILTEVKKSVGTQNIDEKEINTIVEKLQLEVAELEPNYVYELFEADPKAEEQWAVDFVMNERVSPREKNEDAKKIIVAVIDTGTDIFHEDLKDNIWTSKTCLDENGQPIAGGCMNGGWDAVDNDDNPFPTDGYSHGTSVSGMVAASTNNNIGIASVSGMLATNTDIQIMPIRACCSTEGFFESRTIEKSIYFAVQNGADIINMSFGGPTYSERIKQAIEYAEQNGVLVVAAAGNYASNNDTKKIYPANYELDNVVTVGATDKSGGVAYFSNYGQSVDIAFPGANVLSTLPNNKYGYVNGTSFSAPMVAGILAVYISRSQ